MYDSGDNKQLNVYIYIYICTYSIHSSSSQRASGGTTRTWPPSSGKACRVYMYIYIYIYMLFRLFARSVACQFASL